MKGITINYFRLPLTAWVIKSQGKAYCFLSFSQIKLLIDKQKICLTNVVSNGFREQLPLHAPMRGCQGLHLSLADEQKRPSISKGLAFVNQDRFFHQ